MKHIKILEVIMVLFVSSSHMTLFSKVVWIPPFGLICLLPPYSRIVATSLPLLLPFLNNSVLKLSGRTK